jgi:hypothetical protein
MTANITSFITGISNGNKKWKFNCTTPFTVNGNTYTGIITLASTGSDFVVTQRQASPNFHTIQTTDTTFISTVQNGPYIPKNIKNLVGNAQTFLATTRNQVALYLNTSPTATSQSTVDLNNDQSNIYITTAGSNTYFGIYSDIVGPSVSPSSFTFDKPSIINELNGGGGAATLNLSTVSGNAGYFIPMSLSGIGPVSIMGTNAALQYNPSSGTLNVQNLTAPSILSLDAPAIKITPNGSTGVINQVLTTDGAGSVSWQTASLVNLSISGVSDNNNYYLALSNNATGTVTVLNSDANLVFNPASNTLTVDYVNGTAARSDKVMTQEAFTGNYYMPVLADLSGYQILYDVNSIRIDVDDGTITASGFVGDISGTAYKATNIATTQITTSGVFNAAMVANISGTQTVYYTSGVLISASGVVTASSFIGTLSGSAYSANNVNTVQETTGLFNVAMVTNISGIQTIRDTSGVKIDAAGTVSATTFIGALSGTAYTATNVDTQSTVAAGPYYIAGVSSLTGTQVIYDNSGITFNAATSVITASGFAGDLSGTAKYVEAIDTSTNSNHYLAFVSGAVGSKAIYDTSGMTVNPSTKTLNLSTVVYGTTPLNQYISGILQFQGPSQMQSIVKDIKVVNVRANGAAVGLDEYSSIAAALSGSPTVSGATSTNPVVVKIAPGVYMEPQIICKPYVSIVGAGSSATIVKGIDNQTHLFEGASNSSITNLYMEFDTLSGIPVDTSLVHLTDISGTYSSLMGIENVQFGKSHTLCYAQGSISGNNNLVIANSIYGNGATFTNGFKARTNNNGVPTSITIANCGTAGDLTSLLGNVIFVDGLGAEIYVNSHLANTNKPYLSGTGIFANIRNNGVFDIVGSTIEGFETGILNAIGTTQINITSTIFRNNGVDIQLGDVDTTGSFTGQAAYSKFIRGGNNKFIWSFSDLDTRSLEISNTLVTTFPLGTNTEILELVENQGIGLITGGNLSGAYGTGSYVVNVGSSVGYYINNVSELAKSTLSSATVNLSGTLSGTMSQQYLFIDSAGTLTTSYAEPAPTTTIKLGRVGYDLSGIQFIDLVPAPQTNTTQNYGVIAEELFGSLYVYGSIVNYPDTSGGTSITISNGKYYVGAVPFLPSGGGTGGTTTARQLLPYYMSGTSWFTGALRSGPTTIPTDNYNLSGLGLTAILSGQYVKHSLYAVGEGSNEKYFMVYAQQQYATSVLAAAAPLPAPPSWFKEGIIPIASFVVVEGATTIAQIISERPFPISQPSQTSAVTYHESLLGLIDGDAGHTQFLMLNGTKVMSGALNMGGQAIVGTNMLTTSGYVVKNDASGNLYTGLVSLSGETTGTLPNARTTATSSNTINTIVLRDGAGDFAAGIITATDFRGNLSGTAKYANAINITNDNTLGATVYPVWVDANSGNLSGHTSSSVMSFNPAGQYLTVPTFAGALSGSAKFISLSGVNDNVADYYPTVSSVSGTTASQQLAVISSVRMNALSGIVYANKFVGALSGASTLVNTTQTTGPGVYNLTMVLNISGEQVLYDTSGVRVDASTSNIYAANFLGNLSGSAYNASGVTTDAVIDSVEYYPTFVSNISGPAQLVKDYSGFTVNPGTNTLTIGTVFASLSGNAYSASTVATTLVTSGPYYPTFVSAQSGSAQTLYDSSGIYVNASGVIFAAVHAGNLSGSAYNASGISVLATSTPGTYYPLFAANSTGSAQLANDSTSFTFNPGTNVLTVPTVFATLSGTAYNASTIATLELSGRPGVFYPTFVSTISGPIQTVYDSSGIYADSSGVLTATIFAGALSGAASFVSVTNVNAAANYFPTFVSVSGTTASTALDVNGSLYYEPSTGSLYATNFIGNISGTVTSAASITVNNATASGTYYLTFASGQTGIQTIYSNAGIEVNPGTQGILINKLGTGSLISDTQSIGLGDGTLATGTGTFNTAVGYNALNVITTGSGNTAIGNSSAVALTTGNLNTVLGKSAGAGIVGGSRNIFIGLSGGSNIVNTNDNIAIGNLGVAGDVGNIRIGTTGTHTATWIPTPILSRVAAVTYSANVTLTNTDLVAPTGGLINISGGGGGGTITLTTPTGGNISSLFTNVATGDSFSFIISSNNPFSKSIALSGNTGVTLKNDKLIASSVRAVITCINTASGFWDIY